VVVAPIVVVVPAYRGWGYAGGYRGWASIHPFSTPIVVLPADQGWAERPTYPKTAVDNDLASGVISCPLSAEMTPDTNT